MKKFKFTAAALAAAVLMTASGCGKGQEETQQPSGITDQIEADGISGSEEPETTDPDAAHHLHEPLFLRFGAGFRGGNGRGRRRLEL